jgi:VCBS repeat-containing protein
LTVNEVNDPPVAGNDSYSLDEDTSLTIAAPGVLGNDTDVESDPLTAVLNTDVSYGTLVLNANGSFTYTPANNFNGTDTFTYHANDGMDDSNVATVMIVVNPVPDPEVFISVSPSDVTLAPNDVITFELLFGNRGPGTAYGIVISGAVTGDCTLLTSNPIFSSSSMDEGVGLRTVADVQANAPGGACTFTATITSTNGTTDSDSAEINGSTSIWAPSSFRAMVSTNGSDGTIEAAIAFLIPVAMLVTPFILSWWGKLKRTPRPR